MAKAKMTKARFAVTGRNVVECDGRSEFTKPQFLGEVIAFNEDQAEKVAQIRWPGWDDYSLWDTTETVGLVA